MVTGGWKSLCVSTNNIDFTLFMLKIWWICNPKTLFLIWLLQSELINYLSQSPSAPQIVPCPVKAERYHVISSYFMSFFCSTCCLQYLVHTQVICTLMIIIELEWCPYLKRVRKQTAAVLCKEKKNRHKAPEYTSVRLFSDVQKFIF